MPQEESSSANRLEGYTALVTGGAGTVGIGICTRLAREGSNVVIAQRSTDAPKKVIDRIEELGSEAAFVRADLTSESDLRNAVEKTVETFGSLEILVNNAASPSKELANTMSSDTWNKVLTTNLSAPFRLAQIAHEHMVEAGYGRVINIGAIQGQSPLPGAAAYASSKTGLEGLTRSLATEWGESREIDFTSNVVMVGPIYEHADWQEHPELPIEIANERVPEDVDEASSTLIGRWGRASDVAALVSFLAAPESGFITGAVIPCDGGRLLSRKGTSPELSLIDETNR